MRNVIFLLVLLHLSYKSIGQPNDNSRIIQTERINKANDFVNAIDVSRNKHITLEASPLGPGEHIEVQSKASNYYFPRENNIIWLTFKASKSAKLIFKIIPKSENDDYDFLLFKDQGSNTLDLIKDNSLHPLRSNIARSQNVNKGETGLSYISKMANVSSGNRHPFCSFIEMQQGDTYYLVINNVYDGGSGADIIFEQFDLKEFSGKVTDEDNRGIKATIVWEDAESGDEIIRTESDVQGKYDLVVPFEPKSLKKYNLSIVSTNCFFYEERFSPLNIAQCDKEVNVTLTKMSIGASANFENINFNGDSYELLPEAYTTLDKIALLLLESPKIKIELIGHTNGCSGGEQVSQELSESRANAAMNYLTEKGVSRNRLSIRGMNCRDMLFPLTSSEQLQFKNRRVEIKIVEI